MKPHILKKLKKAGLKTKQLQLNSGRIKKLPESICSYSNLNNLDLFNNSLRELPDWIYKLKSLEKLNLKKNRFTEFPTILFVLHKLNTLNLSDNLISTIEVERFEKIYNFKELDISHNSIKSLPIVIPKYFRLEMFNGSSNRLTEFPVALSEVKSLRCIKLSNNNISYLNDEIFEKLIHLTELDLSQNDLTFIPASIGKLKNLKRLNISGNKIKSLPKEFENLQSLENLDLSGNPMENVPIEIKSQGTQSIINYYLSLGDNIDLYEAKLLIVGQGNVGKTYLMNRLIFNEVPKTVSTEGIEIKNWELKTKSSDDFRINVWDFGGQEIYHSTHQFFLTNRSLYLLVWEVRSDEHIYSFDYWLNVIKLLSNNSPIIIVMNKSDERVAEIDERSLKKKYSNIVSFHKVSAMTGENISMLMKEITENIDSLPQIGDRLPKVWLKIRKDLETLDTNYISKDSYFEICNKQGLSDKKALFLSQYFHDLGVFLHFKDDGLLKNLVFLKPEWATNAVYKILDTKSVIENKGEFSIKMLEEILCNYKSDKHSYIVRLMEKFELCFEVEKDKYLIPGLLDPVKQEFDWNYEDNLRFEYHYSFMPAGIMARFIVRARQLVHEKTFWKNGVIIQRENTRALIESDQYLKIIKIWINGENAPFLLEIIRKELDEIHNSLNYYDVPEKIPCNCNICINSETPHLFNYGFIKKASHENTYKTLPCEISMQGVNIHNLIKLYKIKETTQINKEIYSLDRIMYDLIEICSRILERKNNIQEENNSNDKVVDLLRTKGHIVTDQTRSGSSETGIQAGEVDIMIRRHNGIPVTLIECLRLKSCGSSNKEISSHLNKLLSRYDSQGISKNFIIIYSEANRFDNLWMNYREYINNINSKEGYNNKEYPLTGLDIRDDLSGYSNLKICISRHVHNSETREVVHLILNMKN